MAKKPVPQPEPMKPWHDVDELQWWLDSMRSQPPPKEDSMHWTGMVDAAAHEIEQALTKLPRHPDSSPADKTAIDPQDKQSRAALSPDLARIIEEHYGDNENGETRMLNNDAALIQQLLDHYGPQLKQRLGQQKPVLVPGQLPRSLVNIPTQGGVPQGPLVTSAARPIPTLLPGGGLGLLPGAGTMITTPGPKLGGLLTNPQTLAGLRSLHGGTLTNLAKASLKA